MTARLSAYRFYLLHFWHFGILRTLRFSMGGFFFFRCLFLKIWFGPVRGVYIRLNRTPMSLGCVRQRKEKINGISLHYPHFRNLKMQIVRKVWRSRLTFSVTSPCIPCTLAHFENAKVSKMPRSNLEIWMLPKCPIPLKS